MIRRIILLWLLSVIVAWLDFSCQGTCVSGSIKGAGGIGGLLARTDTNGSTYYHADGNGNITALMEGNENIVARYLYNPYGKLLGQWGPMANANTMQFSSMPQRRGIALFPFRGYEPNFQRFLNQDPVGVSGGINFYRYAFNSPLNFMDPLGLNALGAIAGSDLGGTIGSYVGALGTGLLGELGGGAAGTAAEPGGGTIAGGLAGAAAAADIGADVGGTIGSKLGDFLTGNDAAANSPSLSIPDATVNEPAIPTPAISCMADKAPGKPAPNDGYNPPKRGPGSDGDKVKNPNGPGWGWAADDGGVWVPTGEGSLAHGGPHWDVQYPGGGYLNVYPGGRTR